MRSLISPELRAAVAAHPGLTSPAERLALIDARLATLWQAARECETAEQARLIEAEETDLMGERYYLHFLMHPEDFSHA